MRGNAQIRKLTQGLDVEHWNECLAPFLDKGATWSQLPWYVGETYVYHRLLEASGYWDTASPGYGIDIFAPEKRESLEQSLPQVKTRMAICKEAAGQWTLPYFTALLHMSLWGNQVLSSPPALHFRAPCRRISCACGHRSVGRRCRVAGGPRDA